ncbi:MAG: efflux RND transporter periplasmic adaptor subunit [Planctomycetales bacterium]|nr:efflux RND transporter periplasmic adaptor subunit [Planctomycetales bacterium]
MGCAGDVAPPASVALDDKPELATIDVETFEVGRQPWPSLVSSQGSLFGDESSVIGAKVAGRVQKVHVEMGDYVQSGDSLMSLDHDEFQLLVEQADAQLQQARSAVGLSPGADVESLRPDNAPPVRQELALWEEAKNNLRRATELRKNNAISQGDVDQATAAERVAAARHASALNSVAEKIALIGVRKAELSLAQQRLKDATIYSPMAGFVRQRFVAPGAYLSVGQPIVELVRTDPLRYRGSVPEKYAQQLAIGQAVELQIESVPDPITVHITRVSPMLDQTSRALTFEAEVENPDHRIRAGLFAEAKVVLDSEAEALVVPTSAIVEFAGTQKVWKVVDGVAQEMEVLTGERRGAKRSILTGLETGDQILVNGQKGKVAVVHNLQTSQAADHAEVAKE